MHADDEKPCFRIVSLEFGILQRLGLFATWNDRIEGIIKSRQSQLVNVCLFMIFFRRIIFVQFHGLIFLNFHEPLWKVFQRCGEWNMDEWELCLVTND